MAIDSQFSPLISIRKTEPVKLIKPIPVQPGDGGAQYSEKWLQSLFFDRPDAIPIHEIDESFGPLTPVCTELDTRAAGIIDALFVNPQGMLTLIEFKLWRNPE